MDVDTSWRRKRPAEEDEDYLASKRYISEKFFNMRISHPDAPGLHGAGLMWQGAADKAAGVGRGDFAAAGVDCSSIMSDEDISAATGLRPPAAAPSAFSKGGAAAFGDLASLDEDDDASGNDDGAGDASSSVGGGPPTPHPFLRSTSSAVDEKVDDWVRTSRHRMLADASVNSAPDLCRALIPYRPVAGLAPPSAAPGADSTEDEEGRASGYDSGEAGGDPTPSPQAGGDGGGDTAPAAATGAGLGAVMLGGEGGCEQSAGSSTAEAAGFAGTGGRTGSHSHGYANDSGGEAGSDQGQGRNHHHHHHVAGSLFGPPPRGLCTAQSGGDDAGGALMMRDDSSSSSAAAMREDSEAAMRLRDGDDGGRGGGVLPASAATAAAAAAGADAMDMDGTDMAPPDPLPLSRIGSSRGAPTPELTPERAAWARAAPQRRREARGEDDPDEIAGATNARPPLTAQSWARRW
ncbi:unnamed protein product [Ectocarpus fasciculatus]